MRNIYIIASFVVVILMASCGNYNRKMAKAIKKSLGRDINGFQIKSAPTDNFGLLTAYQAEGNKLIPICAMFSCLGIKPAPTPGSKDWLEMLGYADVGKGGTITLSQNVRTKFALNALLPKIYNVAKVSGGFDGNNTTDIQLTLGNFWVRYLNRIPLATFMGTLAPGHPVKDAFASGELVYILGDVVINDLSVTVTVNGQFAADLAAKFNAMPTNSAGAKIISDGELSLEVGRSQTSTYTFKAAGPVIYAVLARRQPGKFEWSTDQNLHLKDSWMTQNLIVPEGPLSGNTIVR